MKSTSQSATAISAAAELRLAAYKSQRVADAENSLSRAETRLAEAQDCERKAADQLAAYETERSRGEVLTARQEIEISSTLVDHARDRVTRAKARHTPQERNAAQKLVTAERRIAALNDDLAPVLADITRLAAELFESYRKVQARLSQQTCHAHDVRSSGMDLGIDPDGVRIAIPDPNRTCALAVLKGIKQQGGAAYQWREIDPTEVVSRPVVLPGSRARSEPPEEIAKRAEAHQARLHAEADANSRSNARATLSAPVDEQSAPAPLGGNRATLGV